jgi:hypothetical protein
LARCDADEDGGTGGENPGGGIRGGGSSGGRSEEVGTEELDTEEEEEGPISTPQISLACARGSV